MLLSYLFQALFVQKKNLSKESLDHCSDVTLNTVSFFLKNVLGKSSSTIYAIALLASGQSSTITGTYAGQYIMQGFLNLKMKMWIRNLVTRSIAIAPSLLVAIIGGPKGAGELIIIASMILSFELPFALMPLLKFSSSSNKMGPHKNSIYIIVFSWFLGLCLIATNIYYLSSAFIDWLIHNKLHKVANIFIGLLVFPLMAIYIVFVFYLAFRKDKAVTFVDISRPGPIAQIQMENGVGPSDNSHTSNQIPHRDDLAEMTLRLMETGSHSLKGIVYSNVKKARCPGCHESSMHGRVHFVMVEFSSYIFRVSTFVAVCVVSSSLGVRLVQTNIQ